MIGLSKCHGQARRSLCGRGGRRPYSPGGSRRGRARLVDHAHRNLHTEAGRRLADETAPERQGLRRVRGHRDTNKITIADDAVGWIEINPARSQQVDLQPSMGCPAADSGCTVCIWHKDVAPHEAGREAKRSDAFDHEQGKVATSSATALKRLAWGLHVPLDAALKNAKPIQFKENIALVL